MACYHWKSLRKYCAAIGYEKPEVTWIIYWIASYLFCLFWWWFGKSWYLNFCSVFSGIIAVRPWQSSTLSHRYVGLSLTGQCAGSSACHGNFSVTQRHRLLPKTAAACLSRSHCMLNECLYLLPERAKKKLLEKMWRENTALCDTGQKQSKDQLCYTLLEGGWGWLADLMWQSAHHSCWCAFSFTEWAVVLQGPLKYIKIMQSCFMHCSYCMTRFS